MSLAKCKQFARFAHTDWDISSAISPLFNLQILQSCQGKIALRDGLGCAVIQVYHFASGARQGPYKAVVRLSHSQHGDLCYHCEYVTVRYYARVKSSSSRKLGFDSYKRRRKVDEHKKLVCCHCHRHHHHHHQKQDIIRFLHTPQDCPGPIVWNDKSRKKYLLISQYQQTTEVSWRACKTDIEKLQTRCL